MNKTREREREKTATIKNNVLTTKEMIRPSLNESTARRKQTYTNEHTV